MKEAVLVLAVDLAEVVILPVPLVLSFAGRGGWMEKKGC